MLQQIHAAGDDAAGFVRKVKSKQAGVQLMGFHYALNTPLRRPCTTTAPNCCTTPASTNH
jgi:hypothetical protein